MKKKFIVYILWCSIISVCAEGVRFDYSRSGQSSWAKAYPDCSGQSQSPIVIAASRSVALPLPALELVGYHDYLQPPIILKNNGYTVSVTSKPNNAHRRVPFIFGALLKENQEYELESFHFHWGLKNSRGSEHLLHGTRQSLPKFISRSKRVNEKSCDSRIHPNWKYPMEMHLIHRNMKYPNLGSALEHEDGLAVLAVFFVLQEEDNILLKPLITHLREVQWANSETFLNHSIILANLLPPDLDTYYTYKGSLTTPPCNEVVTWIVFATPVPISFKQMSKFRLLSSGKSILADNYRFLQDLHNRKVYVRRLHPSILNEIEAFDLDTSNLKWYWQ